jgi:GT2 family glycosyltransferase
MDTKSHSQKLAEQSGSILFIPRCNFLGKTLDFLAGLRCTAKTATRFQNIRRKRFLQKIKGSHHAKFTKRVLTHQAGLKFENYLTRWLASAPFLNAPILNLQNKLSQPNESDRCRASVVINTNGRCRDLKITLGDLKASWNSSQDELIIVMGPTKDGSLDVVSGCDLPLQLIHCPAKNLAMSRNMGLLASSGRYVAFIDDDASPEPGWLDALLVPLQKDHQVAISAGFVLDGSGHKLLNGYVVADTLGRARSFISHQDALDEIRRLGEHRSFPVATGCNMAFRRDLLIDQGGFDEVYEYFLEETDVVKRLIRSGFHCEYAPKSFVRHRLSPNIARKPSFDIEERNTIIRSQIHFIWKYGLSTFSAAEIKWFLWDRLLSNLEKIAWDCANNRLRPTDCGRLQAACIQSVAQHLKEISYRKRGE